MPEIVLEDRRGLLVDDHLAVLYQVRPDDRVGVLGEARLRVGNGLGAQGAREHRSQDDGAGCEDYRAQNEERSQKGQRA